MISEAQRTGLKAFTVKQITEALFKQMSEKAALGVEMGMPPDRAEISAAIAVLVQGVAELHFELAMSNLELTEKLEAATAASLEMTEFKL
jgi:hypothetical protein